MILSSVSTLILLSAVIVSSYVVTCIERGLAIESIRNSSRTFIFPLLKVREENNERCHSYDLSHEGYIAYWYFSGINLNNNAIFNGSRRLQEDAIELIKKKQYASIMSRVKLAMEDELNFHTNDSSIELRNYLIEGRSHVHKKRFRHRFDRRLSNKDPSCQSLSLMCFLANEISESCCLVAVQMSDCNLVTEFHFGELRELNFTTFL